MVQTLQRLGLVPSDLAVSLQTLASHNSPVSEFLKIKVWDLTPSSQKPTRASKTGWASSWPCRAPGSSRQSKSLSPTDPGIGSNQAILRIADSHSPFRESYASQGVRIVVLFCGCCRSAAA